MIIRILFIVAFLAMLFQVCSPKVTGLSTNGTILKSEEDRVFVLFEEELGDPGYFTGGWFYFPGKGIVKKENYKIEVHLIKIR